MAHYYSDDRTTQIVVALMKAHGIRKVVASPGTTNIALVGSLQIDSFFELYSSVDERSAAYIACGLAYETGEPVAITCTEATASRNYLPGLTEAHYRKLPVLAITGNHGISEVGHLKPQVIDRSVAPKDTVHESYNLQKIKDKEDEWDVTVKANKAMLALTHNGGGPAHLNLCFSKNTYNTRELPKVRVIHRYTAEDQLPCLPTGRIAIFVGSHKKWTQQEVDAIDSFCTCHNSVVFCDKTSGYQGLFRVDFSYSTSQLLYIPECKPSLVIHIGEVSGDTYTQNFLKGIETWRVNRDGEIRDTFRALTSVFQMSEMSFFKSYTTENKIDSEYLRICKSVQTEIEGEQVELPFSNAWIAKQLLPSMPPQSILHLGIYNSLRSWNLAGNSSAFDSICNVGGFGIDGVLSTALGSSLAAPDKLVFVVLGDLAFFYDINSLGNRHVGSNLRILLVNNGRGTEFRKYDHPCMVFGDDADSFMAAYGHFGPKSPTLVKSYVESLGFKYYSANEKQEFLNLVEDFVNPAKSAQSIVLEVFVDSKNESDAINACRHTMEDKKIALKNKVIEVLKTIKNKI